MGTVAAQLAAGGDPCAPAFERLVDDVLALPPILRAAVRGLRAAAPALDVACVADSRRATVALTPGVRTDLARKAIAHRVYRDTGSLLLLVSDDVLHEEEPSASASTTMANSGSISSNGSNNTSTTTLLTTAAGALIGVLLAVAVHLMRGTTSRNNGKAGSGVHPLGKAGICHEEGAKLEKNEFFQNHEEDRIELLSAAAQH